MPDLSRLRDIWGSLELRGQVTLVVSLLAVLGTAVFLFRFAAQVRNKAVDAYQELFRMQV